MMKWSKSHSMVDSVKYLGVTINSDKGLSFSAKNELTTFYRAANSVLSSLQKPSEEIMIHLLVTNVIPIITYACGIKQFSSNEMNQCNLAINNALRRIFSFKRWESIRSLWETFGMKSIYDIFANSHDKFHASLSSHHNSIVRRISSLNAQSQ